MFIVYSNAQVLVRWFPFNSFTIRCKNAKVVKYLQMLTFFSVNIKPILSSPEHFAMTEMPVLWMEQVCE